jgi:hypothetical protein
MPKEINFLSILICILLLALGLLVGFGLYSEGVEHDRKMNFLDTLSIGQPFPLNPPFIEQWYPHGTENGMILVLDDAGWVNIRCGLVASTGKWEGNNATLRTD